MKKTEMYFNNKYNQLNAKERKVLALMYAGGNELTIADQLGITCQKVNETRRNAFSKLGLFTQTDMKRYINWIEQYAIQ